MMTSAHSMTSLHSISASRLVSAPRSQSSRRAAKCSPVRAEDKPADKQKLDFQPNTRSGVGYLDEDSAGQTNIFAVEPSQYVKGSNRDDSSGATLLVGGGAAAIGGLILAAGLIGGVGNGGPGTPAEEGLQSLSQYSQQFSAEGTGSSAPSLN